MADFIIIAFIICLCIISGAIILRRKGRCASCSKNCPFCKEKDR